MNDKKRPGVGVGILIWRNGKVLFIERLKPSRIWAAPGGHLEHGESWEECARREAREEVGVEVTNVRFMAVTNDMFSPDSHYVGIWMEADWQAGEPKSREPHKIGKTSWHSLNDLPQPIMEPTWSNLRMIKPELFT